MPTLPWTAATPLADADDTTEVIVLGSKLELRSYRDVPAFLRAAMSVRRQVIDSPGALGVSLIAQPGRKTFWTLSAWTDQDVLDAFVRAQPHLGVMQRFRGRLADSGFITFGVRVGALPEPKSNAKDVWRQAWERLAASSAGAAR
jgi:hypothetical protein